MISRLVWVLLLIPAAIVLIALSVANRNIVPLTIDPFNAGNPYLTLNGPLFAFLFASLGIGLIVGSLTTWFAQGKNRRKAREAVAEADRLKAEMRRRDEQLRGTSAITTVS